MKNLLLITLASVLFACQSHPYNHPESTLEDFDSEQITSNNLKSIMEYLRVPDTNRDSLTEPIGLMLIGELRFNENGQLQTTRCFGCAVRSHGEPTYVDKIRMLEYENGLLKKYKSLEFDTTLFEIQYFSGKSLTKGYRDGRLGYTSIERYDSLGRLIKKLEFEFFNSYAYEQNVQQVYLTKVTYEYDPETTYKQTFRQAGYNEMISLTTKQFASLYTDNIERIEDLSHLYALEPIGTEVIMKLKSGNVTHRQMHNTAFPDETFYEYDERGLVKMKRNSYNGHESISEYRYEKW